jgi:hypothetical protein
VHRLDEIDLHILQELQRDSSRTNVQLARAVGLSPPACLLLGASASRLPRFRAAASPGA